MKSLPLALIAPLSLLVACGGGTKPATVSLSASVDQAKPGTIIVNVGVEGEKLESVVLLRDSSDDGKEQFTELKRVTAAPFSFTYEDKVDYGTYIYRVKVVNSIYESSVDRKMVFSKESAGTGDTGAGLKTAK